ncbi:MAG: hypothetical protein ACMG6E_05135 [Candidatus Roizmanbacteria bacterium]
MVGDCLRIVGGLLESLVLAALGSILVLGAVSAARPDARVHLAVWLLLDLLGVLRGSAARGH